MSVDRAPTVGPEPPRDAPPCRALQSTGRGRLRVPMRGGSQGVVSEGSKGSMGVWRRKLEIHFCLFLLKETG